MRFDESMSPYDKNEMFVSVDNPSGRLTQASFEREYIQQASPEPPPALSPMAECLLNILMLHFADEQEWPSVRELGRHARFEHGPYQLIQECLLELNHKTYVDFCGKNPMTPQGQLNIRRINRHPDGHRVRTAWLPVNSNPIQTEPAEELEHAREILKLFIPLDQIEEEERNRHKRIYTIPVRTVLNLDEEDYVHAANQIDPRQTAPLRDGAIGFQHGYTEYRFVPASPLPSLKAGSSPEAHG